MSGKGFFFFHTRILHLSVFFHTFMDITDKIFKFISKKMSIFALNITFWGQDRLKMEISNLRVSLCKTGYLDWVVN